MSIITISRGSYSRGKEVAEKVAQKLGYSCIARDDVIEEASDEFNIPEIKLVRAIHDAPSILSRFTYGQERFVAYFQAALLEHLQKDNAVYHGLAGHFFLKGVSHVLKVRIIADMDDRVRFEVEREHISEKEALQVLKKDDEERARWSRHLYGIDTTDPSLYDLVVHIKTITAADAADIICHTVGLPRFQTTPESGRALADLALSAKVKAAIISVKPDAEVTAHDGTVHVKTSALVSQREKLFQDINKNAEGIKGLKDIQIDIKSMTP
ncbi:MAG TPA: cytidylate kinase-like family protein [bacterium]|nr:cytidylate kinase-like family protein [bacterium]